MKKSALCIAMVLASFTLATAQKSNVNKASNMLITEPINYEEARSLIAAAKENPETANDAKTWYVAGRIGYQQAYAQRNVYYLGQPFDATLAGQGLDEMFQNYVEADSRDGVPDKKGRIKYKQRKKIQGDFKDMLDFYSIVGSFLYQEAKYNEAYTAFYEYSKIMDLPMFTDNEKDAIKVDSLYNESKYFAALSAIQAGNNDEGIKLLEEVTKTDYKNNIGVYVLLSEQYLFVKSDSAKYENLLAEAIDRYPSSPELIGTLVNYYVNSGAYDKAVTYLDALIANDPENIEYLGVKAELLTQQADFETAKDILNKALASKQGDAYLTFLLGRTWAFEGDHIQEEAMDFTDNDKYNEAMAKAKECYATALNYFETAHPIMDKADSRYMDLLQNMKVLYLRMENTDKYNEIDAEMKAMEESQQQ
ncbi:MAG: tetratricopeptide repeat protein [Bacteroidetes bacterium]|uniref:Tetratricopeptide repeat protein n=1 Tax=Candidatus Enterocola intestinipullorum TaxID=2840783 RepID=A0A9D9HEB8_9BACT|nr:tetratricopeptide repeat protein [Candidatus Enterocola intestinipullorum]